MFDVPQASKPVTGLDLLQHATKVVRPGRPFLHRLYTLQNPGQTLLGDIYLLKGGTVLMA